MKEQESNNSNENNHQSKSHLEKKAIKLDKFTTDALDNILARVSAEKDPDFALNVSVILANLGRSGYDVDEYMEQFDEVIAANRKHKYNKAVGTYANVLYQLR